MRSRSGLSNVSLLLITFLASACNMVNSSGGAAGSGVNSSNTSNSGFYGNAPASSSSSGVVTIPATNPTATSTATGAASASAEHLLAHPFATTMPLYDETDTSLATTTPLYNGNTNWISTSTVTSAPDSSTSQLCAPVAGTMALAAVLGLIGAGNVNSTSWLATSFEIQGTWQSEVIQMALKMLTSPTIGTYFIGSGTNNDARTGIAGRASDFTSGKSTGISSGYRVSNIPATPYPYIQALRGIQTSTSTSLYGFPSGGIVANVLLIGYYTVSQGNGTTSGGVTTYAANFTRAGGHFVTVEGYDSTASDLYLSGALNPSTTASLYLNNPWGGIQDKWPLTDLTVGSTVPGTSYVVSALPNGYAGTGMTQAYINSDYVVSGSSTLLRFWMVEGVTGLSVNH